MFCSECNGDKFAFFFTQEAELNYTIGRLVQGLASTRQCARHGYYTTLVGILKIFPIEQLPSHVIHDTIKSRLSVEGTKKVTLQSAHKHS